MLLRTSSMMDKLPLPSANPLCPTVCVRVGVCAKEIGGSLHSYLIFTNKTQSGEKIGTV